MDHENLRKLVELMKGVIGEGHAKVMTIRNSQYNSFYLNIFFDEIEKNGGDATAYDRFGDQLWTDLGVDINDHAAVGEDFMLVWTAWKTMYDALRAKGLIKQT
jgi:hypothetical protein